MWSKLIVLDLVCLVALVDAIIAVKTDVEQTDPAGSGFSWWPWCWPQIPPLRRGDKPYTLGGNHAGYLHT